ncbi:glycoside hydrolase family 2 TIM barrel-domain containing protein [Streptomyces sp. RTd22]|uniref:glycoside hydrolase family 2 TIM barrel-domain containing protein n=3 Tax=Streptomyces sp. RTd22 TaxID=1841249 RepID=UPI0007DA3D6B|nr:glycoside hydrolase family 2 TIM barrel-domain containing protein [Streptomyces sp. RTd22]
MAVTRRSLLIAGTATPMAGALATATPASGAGPSRALGGRTLPLTDGWRFALVNPGGITDPTGDYDDAHTPGYDDSTWREVAIPHDWSIEQTPTTDHGTNGGTGYLPGGLGWYRKSFTLPSGVAGKRISVEFDGVYMDAYVYCNGKLVGNHPYGYTGFALDLTDVAHTDGTTPNILAVQVRNQLPSSRWYSGSGIYRHARLVITDPVHVARWGTYITTPTLSDNRATVRARTSVVNASGDDQSVTIVSTLKDPDGRTVTHARSTLTVGADSTRDATQELTVDRPRLWSFDTPRLYTLETELRVAGKTTDRYRTPFGIRHVTIDPNQGLTLNGEYTKLQGVNLHHDLGALGAAFNTDAFVRQMTIMKSMGVNALRTSHNPPAPEVVEVCDRLGIVMMVEAFDCWRTGKTAHDYGRFFDKYCEADTAEMVGAARNSPAVIMWSIGNEITDSTSTPGLAMAQRIIDAIKKTDDTRPIVIGSNKYRGGPPAPGSAADLMLAKVDGLGLNYNIASSADALHARYPNLFLFESETSSATSSRGAYQEPEHLNTGENQTPGKREASSYDNNIVNWAASGEYELKKERDRPYLTGQFLWSGIDYIGEPTPYKVFPVKASFFGAVDTAGFAKDAYYLFKSQWTSEPMVHLVPMNWTDHRPGETVEVWAYANVDTVELFLNGDSLGIRRFDTKKTTDGRTYLETTEASGDDKTVTTGSYPGSYTSPNGSAGKLHLTWKVPFAPGELKAVARRGGRVVATDVLRTAGRPHAIRLTPDRKTVDADGRSLSFITAEVVDAHGVLVPSADHLISFEVSGGALAGVDNGRQESAERYQASTRTAYHGKALAIIRTGTKPGPLTITARSTGLRKATTTVRATGGTRTRITPTPPFTPDPGPAASTYPLADASYSGSLTTLPASMLDGDPATGWSNAFTKVATSLLPAFNGARKADGVSVTWARKRRVRRVEVSFTLDTTHTLPASVTVSAWDGHRFTPVRNAHITWAEASDTPTVVTFDPVRTSRLRLDLVSAHPGAADGAQRITRLEALDD